MYLGGVSFCAKLFNICLCHDRVFTFLIFFIKIRKPRLKIYFFDGYWIYFYAVFYFDENKKKLFWHFSKKLDILEQSLLYTKYIFLSISYIQDIWWFFFIFQLTLTRRATGKRYTNCMKSNYISLISYTSWIQIIWVK